MAPSDVPVSRRRFLAGGAAAAGVVLLGACGGGDDADEPADASSSTTRPENERGLGLAQFFGGPMFVAGTTIRAPFGLADKDGLLPPEATPAELSVQLVDEDDRPIGDPVAVPRHDQGLARPYFPFVADIAEPGVYKAIAEHDGIAIDASFQVLTPGQVKVIQVGAPFPSIDTPTTADARGVTPICTRSPVCELHGATAKEVLAAGQPMAFLVATPAFCQITVCGPVLDVLIKELAAAPHVTGLHAEVYANPAVDLQTFAPAAGALGLHYEPCLVLVGSDGLVKERLDTIYDEAELKAALAALS
jgi:hypothetical protein